MHERAQGRVRRAEIRHRTSTTRRLSWGAKGAVRLACAGNRGAEHSCFGHYIRRRQLLQVDEADIGCNSWFDTLTIAEFRPCPGQALSTNEAQNFFAASKRARTILCLTLTNWSMAGTKCTLPLLDSKPWPVIKKTRFLVRAIKTLLTKNDLDEIDATLVDILGLLHSFLERNRRQRDRLNRSIQLFTEIRDETSDLRALIIANAPDDAPDD